MHYDPQWPRASEWLAAGEGNDLTVIGCPINVSITPGRCDLAPAAIRTALARYSTFDFRTGIDIREVGVRDLGDGLDRISGKSAILGGDNGVTPVGVNALGTDLSRVGVITLDAHLDLRTLETGPMNGNPIRGLLEDGVRGENIAQIGLQSFANSTDYALFGMQSGIAQYTVEECVSRGVPVLLQEAVRNIEDRVDAIYLDIDLDAMDAAFAPGCPGARPGGLNPADLFFAARFGGMHPKVVAMDLVELDPERDQQDRTALAAARCLLEFALGIAEAKRG